MSQQADRSGETEGTGTLGKVVASGIVIVLALPGLIIEPGPLSEVAAFGILYAIWFGGEDPDEAVKAATVPEGVETEASEA